MAFWKDDNTPEPLRAHRWYIEFTNKEPSFKDIRFALKECKKPEFEVNTTEHKRLNHVVRLPGILKWKPITVKFASIRDSKSPTLDAGSIIYNAIKKGGYSNPVSFLEGALSKYSMHDAVEKGALNIIQVDADGKPIEVWSLFKAIITSVNFGTLSYESEDIVNIECTITYDYAELNNTQREDRLNIKGNSSNETQAIATGPAESKKLNGLANALDNRITLTPNKFYHPRDFALKDDQGKPASSKTLKASRTAVGPLIKDVEYDEIPKDKFEQAIKLVTAKDANDLGRLIKISRADNRAKSRDLSGEYNEFQDATDNDPKDNINDDGLKFDDTIKDAKDNPIDTEEKVRKDIDIALNKEEQRKAELQYELDRQKYLEAEAQKSLEEEQANKILEEKLEWQRLTAEQDAKDASSNKDNLASNIPQARSKAEQEAEKLTYDLEAEQTTPSGGEFSVEEMEAMKASDPAYTWQEINDEFSGVEFSSPESNAAALEYSDDADLDILDPGTDLEGALGIKSDEEIRKDLSDESARLEAEEKIARDEAATAKANETLQSMQKIPDSSENDSFDSNSEGNSLYPKLDENGNVAGTINYQENNEFINDQQQVEYGPEAPSKQQWAEMSGEQQQIEYGPEAPSEQERAEMSGEQQQVEYGPEAPSEQEWAQMNADKTKRETPNLLGDLDNGKSASEAFEGVSVQEETTPLETGPKGGSSGEVAKAGSVKSTSKIDSAYDDDIIGSSGPKIESYKDESLSSSNKYDEATIPTVAGAKYQVKERVDSIDDVSKIDARLRELNRQTSEALSEANRTKDYDYFSTYQERAKYERELLKARKSELEKKKN